MADVNGAGVLEGRGLRVGYAAGRRRTTVVLDGLDLTLEAGEVTFLLGPNGSGKSTLLRTLAGLQPPLAGRVTLLGDDVGRLPPVERARRLAVVLTDRLDAGLMRVADLVALGRHPHTGWSGRLGEHDHACVRWALHASGALGLAGRQVAELSDGERQRVLIARALAQQPAVLALDEPVAFVDVPRRVELVGLLRRLARERGLAVLLTTHDLDLAIRTADRVWLVEPRPRGGAVVHVAAPEDLVLSGAVARAFRSDEVAFDVERGMFRPRPLPLARVGVRGAGPAAVWAARALEREGVAAAEPAGGDGLEIEVTGASGAPRWTLRGGGGGAVTYTSVGALVAGVRARLPGPGPAPVPDAGRGPYPVAGGVTDG